MLTTRATQKAELIATTLVFAVKVQPGLGPSRWAHGSGKGRGLVSG